jgi:hypothetical protein
MQTSYAVDVPSGDSHGDGDWQNLNQNLIFNKIFS